MRYIDGDKLVASRLKLADVVTLVFLRRVKVAAIKEHVTSMLLHMYSPYAQNRIAHSRSETEPGTADTKLEKNLRILLRAALVRRKILHPCL
jgi:hypothetical protein